MTPEHTLIAFSCFCLCSSLCSCISSTSLSCCSTICAACLSVKPSNTKEILGKHLFLSTKFSDNLATHYFQGTNIQLNLATSDTKHSHSNPAQIISVNHLTSIHNLLLNLATSVILSNKSLLGIILRQTLKYKTLQSTLYHIPVLPL